MKTRLQATGYIEIREAVSTRATPQGAASVPKWRLPWKFAAEDAGQGMRSADAERILIREAVSTRATPQGTVSVPKWRLPWKFAAEDAGQGMRSADEECISKYSTKASTAMTQSCASAVEFTRQSGFTILEIILAMAVLALLAGAIYAISMAAMQATQETLEEQLTIRRLEGFLRVTRDAFLNLPANGSVYLDSSNSSGIPDLYFEHGSTLFGIPSLGGGTLILSARPKPDGTRTFSVLRLPKNVEGNDRDHLYDQGNWMSLLPKVIKPHWSFFKNGEWLDEWPQGAGRPQLIRLEMNLRSLHDPIVATFYLPPVSRMTLSSALDDLLEKLRALRALRENSNQP